MDIKTGVLIGVLVAIAIAIIWEFWSYLTHRFERKVEIAEESERRRRETLQNEEEGSKQSVKPPMEEEGILDETKKFKTPPTVIVCSLTDSNKPCHQLEAALYRVLLERGARVELPPLDYTVSFETISPIAKSLDGNTYFLVAILCEPGQDEDQDWDAACRLLRRSGDKINVVAAISAGPQDTDDELAEEIVGECIDRLNEIP